MKTKFPSFLIFMVMMIPGASARALTTVEDLKVDCTASAQIVSAKEAYFSTGRDAIGRAPQQLPSAGFRADLTLSDFSAGCTVLESKYAIDLQAMFKTSAWLKNPMSLDASKNGAQASVGKKIPVTLSQAFPYVYNEKYLPYFPEVHAESLYFSGALDSVSVSFNVPFSVERVYGTQPISKMTDEAKIQLATKILPQMIGLAGDGSIDGSGGWGGLFFELEPQSLPGPYAELILKFFAEVRERAPYTHFFQFNVGGVGYFEGAKFAQKFNQLSHSPGVVTDAQMLFAMHVAPAILLTGYEPLQKINLTPELLEQYLSEIYAQLGVLTGAQKYELKDAMTVIAKLEGAIGGIDAAMITPKAVGIALEILKHL